MTVANPNLNPDPNPNSLSVTGRSKLLLGVSLAVWRYVFCLPPNPFMTFMSHEAISKRQKMDRTTSVARWPTPSSTGAVKARLCPNGWGDRLLSLLAFATLASLDGAQRLLVYWPEHEREGASVDAVNDLSRAARHFVLPRHIRVTNDWAAFTAEPAFWYDNDGPRSQDLYPKAISRVFKRPLADVMRAYDVVRVDLVEPSDAIRRALEKQLPTHFSAVHLRRGDKIRQRGQVGFETNDRISIDSTELLELQERTVRAMPAEGTLLLCSDDTSAAAALRASLFPRSVLTLRYESTTHVDTSFLDFFALSRASTILLSQRWSAFSFTACLVGKNSCEYHITWPQSAHLRDMHQSGFPIAIRPKLLHIFGCHADSQGSQLPLPQEWLANFAGHGAVITNACSGRKWQGHPLTDYQPHPTLKKVRAMHQAVHSIVAEGGAENAVVLFAEDDVLVNFDGSADALLRRFDEARANKPIVFGMEPSCWLSRACTPKEMRALYPDAFSRFSRCPSFVNTGLYVGEARPLLTLLEAWVRRTEPSDQERLVKALSEGYADMVHLDRTEALFATAMTVTQTATVAATQTATGHKAANCTPCAGFAQCFCELNVPHAWARERSSRPWQRLPDYQAECGTGRWPAPLIIHGNGPSEAMLPALRRRETADQDGSRRRAKTNGQSVTLSPKSGVEDFVQIRE